MTGKKPLVNLISSGVLTMNQGKLMFLQTGVFLVFGFDTSLPGYNKEQIK